MLTAIEFQPGINLDDTDLSAENQYVFGNNVRFRRGRPQLVGGWESATTDTFSNPARGGHAWATLSGDRVVGFGTATNLYAFYGGAILDVTPLKGKGTLVDPFATTNGSAVVVVTDIDHGFKTGDVVTFSNADAVGGITIDGDYEITVLTIDSYTITHTSNASSTATGGGRVEFTCQLDGGLVDGVGGTGYGTGTYGTGLYGLPTGGDVDPRTWSIDNWGTSMLAVPSNGALYEYQPYPTYDELVSNGSFASSAGWITGAGWSIGSGVATGSAGSESAVAQDMTGVLSGGVVYLLEFDATVAAGSFKFQVVGLDGTVDLGEPVAKTASYSRRFRAPASPTAIRFLKDASFNGTLDNVSIKVESVAYRITSAPQYSRCMFVDPNRFVVCCGTVEADGDYNPMLVRWSAQEDNGVWIPDGDNLAGEYVLGRGSKIIAAIPGRGQNLIFTDEALYVMRFVGDSDTVFRFDLVGTGCGAIGKNAVCEHQGSVFWWARNGQFYTFRGGEPQRIVCPVRRTTWTNFAPSQQEKVYAGVNSEYDEIWWFYPDSRDGNECSRYVAFNWIEDCWFTGQLARSTWVPAGVFENPIGFTPGTRKVYFHERGYTADGPTIDWELTTGKFNIDDGENLLAIRRYVPDFEDQVGNVNVTMDFFGWPRLTRMGTYSGTIAPSTAELLMRNMGREAQITWSDGTNCQRVRWGTQRLDVLKTGAKR